MEYRFPDSDRHVILLTNDGSTLSAEVLRQLEKSGRRALVLNLPYIDQAILPDSVNISDYSEEAIQVALRKVESEFGEIGGFIHLHPHLEFQNGRFNQHFDLEKKILKTVFLLAKHLQKRLVPFGKKRRAGFMTVSRMDGELGLGKRSDISILAGGLIGLVKSLKLEWPSVFCRALDIQPELPKEAIASQIVVEFHDADFTVVETAYSEKGRKTIAAKPVPLFEGQKIKTTLTQNSVFLVSGGARGVTAACVIEMAKAFRCKFILLGRSDADFKLPAFAKDETDERSLKRLIMNDLKERGEKPDLAKVKQIYKNIAAKQEIDQTIRQIQNFGGQAAYLQGDVTNAESFKADLSAITQNLGPISGLIHGAGRLADKYIQDKSEKDVENVLSVKVDGLVNLLKVVVVNQLDHLILFSSVAGFYGNIGQTDYAAANEILNKAAHLFKTNHPNAQVSAINWGAWDSGMVSSGLKAQFEAAGIQLISRPAGAALLVNELNVDYASQRQVVIGDIMPGAASYLSEDLRTYHCRRKLKLEDNSFLHHHVIQEKPVLPVVNAVGWMAQACERLYPGFRIYEVANTRLYKGVVFDGRQAENYLLELKEVEKSENEIHFQCALMSEGGKLPLPHYKAEVKLIAQKAKVESPVFTPILSGTYEATDGAEIYQSGALFHGPYFQGIEKVLDITSEQIVLACKAPPVPVSDQGQFPVGFVNTFFADIQYQGMVVWVQKQMGGAKSLPLQTKNVKIYRPLPFNTPLYVHVKIEEADDYKMSATCTVYDEEGKVFMITEGATVTISKELVW